MTNYSDLYDKTASVSLDDARSNSMTFAELHEMSGDIILIVPEGTHDMTCTWAEPHVSKAGNEGFKLQFRPVNTNFDDLAVYDYITFSPRAQRFTTAKLAALRVSMSHIREADSQAEAAKLFVGRPVRARVIHEECDGQPAPKIRSMTANPELLL